jgi:hypothetical protein
MLSLSEYVQLLFIVPILIYIGICIIIDKQNKYLGILFIFAFGAILILHTAKIINISKNLFDEKPFEPSVGIFLLFLGIFFLFSSIYNITNKLKIQK